MEELIRNIISDNSVETSLKEYGQGIFIDVNTIDVMIEELKNLTVTHSSLQLKEKELQSFEDWIDFNGYRKEYTDLVDNGFAYDIGVLYRKYTQAIK